LHVERRTQNGERRTIFLRCEDAGYDDFYHFKKFSDPGFLYGRALSHFVGTAVIRLADADLLPYEFTGLADTVQT
jgi:hypothetical protein